MASKYLRGEGLSSTWRVNHSPNRLLNVKIAEAHLAAHDPKMAKRTWQDVMDHMMSRDGEVRESTLNRCKVAFKSKPFDHIRNKNLVETVSEDCIHMLKAGAQGCTTRTTTGPDTRHGSSRLQSPTHPQ